MLSVNFTLDYSRTINMGEVCIDLSLNAVYVCIKNNNINAKKVSRWREMNLVVMMVG